VVAVPFDVRKLEVTGPAATALEFVVVKGGGATELAVTPSGTMAYVEGIVRQQLVLVDRAGLAQALLPVVKRLANPRLSPSGDRAAITIAEDGNATTATDIWIVNVASHQLARLTNDGRSSQPEWSPDGKRIVWLFKADSGNEVRTQAWDGSGKPETIPTPGHSFNSAVPSPTGGSFVSSQFSKPPGLNEDIWITPMAGGNTARALLRAAEDEYMPRLSSDGKWLAYIAGDGTNYQVYVTPADGSGSPRQISTAGAFEPMWSPAGLSLFYREAGRMVESRITSSSPFQVTTDTLFTDSFRQDVGYPAFDVARDGQHFLMLRTGDQRERVVVTIGWFDELRARMGQVPKK
jgi:TolB protein